MTLYDLTAKSCVVSPRPFQPFDLNSNVPDSLTYNSVLEIVWSLCVLLLVCCTSRSSSAFVAPLSLSLSLSLEKTTRSNIRGGRRIYAKQLLCCSVFRRRRRRRLLVSTSFGCPEYWVQLVEEIILVSLGVRALPEINIACKKRKRVVEGGEDRSCRLIVW